MVRPACHAPVPSAHVSPDQHSPDQVAAVLAATADAVRNTLSVAESWGEAGTRPGQHHSDLAADAAAVGVLTGAGFGVLSEESGGRHLDRPVVVVLDPLDGSTNASRKMGAWAVSLCALDAEGPWVALVEDLRHGIRWTAVRGGGARRDGAVIHTSGCTDLSAAIVGLNGVPAGHGGWAQYRAFGAAALDICAVADGTLDGYLDCTTDELGVWDYLGATLVCREAGGTVVDGAGRDLAILEHSARRIPVAAATAKLVDLLVPLHPGRP